MPLIPKELPKGDILSFIDIADLPLIVITDQLSCLEVRLKEERKVVSINDALKKCEEELAIAKNRLRHEEEDFQQREKALIHGYTAEINNLKSQMALLKSRNLGKCVATSPMRAATPDKSKSPARTRRRILGGGDRSKGKKRKGVDMEESFRMDLVQQLKDLYAELNQVMVMDSIWIHCPCHA